MWRSGVVAQGRALLDTVRIAARSLRPAAGRRLYEQLLAAVQWTEGVNPRDPGRSGGGQRGGDAWPWRILRNEMSFAEETRVFWWWCNQSVMPQRPLWTGQTPLWSSQTLVDVLRRAFDEAMRDSGADGSTRDMLGGGARSGQLGMVLVAAVAADRRGVLPQWRPR